MYRNELKLRICFQQITYHQIKSTNSESTVGGSDVQKPNFHGEIKAYMRAD